MEQKSDELSSTTTDESGDEAVRRIMRVGKTKRCSIKRKQVAAKRTNKKAKGNQKAKKKGDDKQDQAEELSEGENVLDAEEEFEVAAENDAQAEMIGKSGKKEKYVEQKVWKKGDWKVNKRMQSGGNKFKPQLNLPLLETQDIIDFLHAFMPKEFFKNNILHLLNDVSYEEFIVFLGILLSMQVYSLPEREMYWWEKDHGHFKALNYGRFMKGGRFNYIMRYFLAPADIDEDEMTQYQDDLILRLIESVNRVFQQTLIPGYVLVMDESMVKSFHHNLKGKIKIIRKPRPIGNEFKNVCCGLSRIVVNIELFEGKEIMAEKEHVDVYGATTATSLRLTEPWRASGRIVIADSWFGSVKTAVQLWNINGLHSNLIVKTAHKLYPKDTIAGQLNRGEWKSVVATIEDVPLLAVRFMDLQDKQFITTYAASIPGPPRKTKHHGEITRPVVAFEYLSYCNGIDVHNHYRTGSRGLEDVWHTHSPHIRQFTGIMSFVFTNAFLAHKYFKDPEMKHLDFKIKLSSAMMSANANVGRRNSNINSSYNLATVPVNSSVEHLPVNTTVKISNTNKLRQRYCFFCQHVRNPPKPRVKTSVECSTCGIPLCSPLIRDCFAEHITQGVTKESKKYRRAPVTRKR